MLQRFLARFLLILNKLASILAKTKLRNFPFVKMAYREAYYFLDELRWLLWRGEKVVEIEGSKMYLNPRAKGPMKTAFRAYLSSPKEGLTTELFKKVVKKGDIVLDLGANIGYFTLLAAKIVGSTGRVYAFEPEPRNYAMLLKNIKLNNYDNVVPVQKAVSDETRKVRLYLSLMDVGAHTLRKFHDKRQFDRKETGEFVEVESVRLDDFFEYRNERIDVIKMDVEGAEAAALIGMDEIIKQNRDLKMFIEFYPAAIREMGYSPEGLADRVFKRYGFSVIAIDELRMVTNRYFEINDPEELMNVCKDEEKILNLFLERK